MGLCSFKFFKSRALLSQQRLRAAILNNDTVTLRQWAHENYHVMTSQMDAVTSPLDIVVGEKAEPPVLFAVLKMCQEMKRGLTGHNICLETVQTLLELGFSPNAPSQDAVALTPCFVASRYGNYDVLRLLLTFNADPSIPTHQGQTAIIMATALGFLDCTRALLDAGIDANTVTTAINGTAMHLAAPSGHSKAEDICRLLIEYGADVHRRNSPGRTPLHCVCESRRDLTSMVQFLLNEGSDINSQDNKGFTPLMRSMMVGNVTTAMFLVAKGADVTLRDAMGRTAHDIGRTKRTLTEQDLEQVFAKGLNGNGGLLNYL